MFDVVEGSGTPWDEPLHCVGEADNWRAEAERADNPVVRRLCLKMARACEALALIALRQRTRRRELHLVSAGTTEPAGDPQH